MHMNTRLNPGLIDIFRAREMSLADRGWCSGEFILREPIRASWQRSMDYGLQPDTDPAGSDQVALGAEDLYESNRMLLDCAEPALQHLTDRLGHHGNDSLLILVNAQATVLAIEGGSSKWRELRDLNPGVCWSEAQRGTNALGTALVEGRPTMIGYGEHFLDRLSIFSCAAVPIRNPQGIIEGVLDLTRQGPTLQAQDSLLLLDMTASQIESRLFISSYGHQYVVAFHPRQQYLDTAWQGLLALDQEGRILAANERACEFFAMDRKQLVGQPGEGLIRGWQERFGQLRRGISGSLRTPRGDFFYKTLHRPEPLSVPVHQPGVRKGNTTPSLETLAGSSNPRYLRELNMAVRGLRHDLPILLLGETGSGKEWVARALHQSSQRADKPFIAVNCAAIPEGLIESELFGYRDGAFTGARRGGMTGRLQQAHGGTLFLDEVGDMPLALQARLLRVLQERKVAPLGAGIEQDLDINLICATHRPVKALVAEGDFREDLFYRINGMSVHLPPLRERRDLRELCHSLLRRLGGGEVMLAEEVLQLFEGYHWPGNIRQLEMVLRTLLAMRLPEDRELGLDHLPATTMEELIAEEASAPDTNIRVREQELIRQALAEHDGNVSAAARMLGISRATLYRKLKQAG
ncbi:sigma-54-dependent Fis family transcriptional regulator [Halopseudomonas xiamenensis]|uniref:sigma-54-dependent Fis family transcriptional regulator n=1 Tax=Halopseudomonas xiamenensis TaxID=157792 RepID=UPI001F394026|nr:sigma-54-dependent Fis family transcriptional regulator [Halopseudomonas xiamenensis]